MENEIVRAMATQVVCPQLIEQRSPVLWRDTLLARSTKVFDRAGMLPKAL